MPLHIDYRPKDFKSVYGNESTIESLKSIFGRESDFPHAILFQGSSGCGKTTLARIVKDELGCMGSDYVEINAANNRGIDTIRHITDNMKYRPGVPGSKCRVWLLDEAHMITGDAANALLKALEEPPSTAFFILCTTDPQKLIQTIKNRCTTFEVKPLTNSQMVDLLKDVLNKEKIDDIPNNIIEKIADISEGCPRQALVILDKVIDITDLDKMELAIEDFRTFERNIIDLCKGLLNGDNWKRISGVLKLMDLTNPESIRKGIVKWMSDTVMRDGNNQAAMIYEIFKNPFYNNGKYDFIMACHKVVVMST